MNELQHGAHVEGGVERAEELAHARVFASRVLEVFHPSDGKLSDAIGADALKEYGKMWDELVGGHSELLNNLSRERAGDILSMLAEKTFQNLRQNDGHRFTDEEFADGLDDVQVELILKLRARAV